MFKKIIPILIILGISLLFFWKVFVHNLVPIPADTIVGLYHPYRDAYVKQYPNGIPFKNFLITDPVRQQIPWRELSSSLSTWNPYSFSGAPLQPNIQSAYFYPFNVVYLFANALQSWVFLIMLQVFLAATFLYLYLRNLKLDIYSSLFGSIVFAFGGFSAMWLEWGTILHTALWLPLALMSIDKIFKFSLNRRKALVWSTVLLASVSFSILAGHLQTFVYLIIFSIIYFLARFYQTRNVKALLFTGGSMLLALILTAIQTVSTFKLISLSARSLDQADWQKDGWFLPFEHLFQFFAPDFFGNPTTLNYWGTWNYGELTAYVGVLTIIFSIFAMYYRRDKKTLFFGIGFFVSLLMALPTFIAKVPFILEIPFWSTAQPTRLIFIITFTLAVLGALGLNHFLITKDKKNILVPIGVIFVIYILLFAISHFGTSLGLDPVDAAVAKRNMILPILTFVAVSGVIAVSMFLKKKYVPLALMILLIILVFDLFRFSWKFNTFSEPEYLYPETTTTKFIKSNIGNGKIATNDSRIFAPNFSIIHKIPSVEGYDPIYLQRYGELIAAINRGKPDVSPPFGFNRIVRVENFDSPLINILGIKYVLSLNEMDRDDFMLVHQEGETRVYENENVLPYVYFPEEIRIASDKYEAIEKMFDDDFDPQKSVVVESDDNLSTNPSGEVIVEKISDYELKLQVNSEKEALLVIIDSFYPSWEAGVYNSSGDMIEELKIYRTNYNYKGILVPKGESTIFLKNKIL